MWRENAKVSGEKYLSALRTYNAKVMDRARAYLTTSQTEQIQSLLDSQIRRYELLTELAEIDE